MKNYKIRPLFAIPLFQSTVDVSKEEKDYIINNVEFKRYPADNGFGSTSKFLLNDDLVSIVESKPISKLKSWKVLSNSGDKS